MTIDGRLPGASIRIAGKEETAGSDGTFAFAGLSAGRHELTASLADHEHCTTEISLTADTEIVIELKPVGDEDNPPDGDGGSPDEGNGGDDPRG